MGHKCVNDENLCEIHGDNVNCEKCMCNDMKVISNLLVTALIIVINDLCGTCAVTFGKINVPS